MSVHRIWIRGYQREGEWVDGYWRKIDDLAKAIPRLSKPENAAIQLPDGIEIHAEYGGGTANFIITGGGESPERVGPDYREAARTALQRSARNTNPRSLGGAKKFQTHVQAAKHDRARARRGKLDTPEPTPKPEPGRSVLPEGAIPLRLNTDVQPGDRILKPFAKPLPPDQAIRPQYSTYRVVAVKEGKVKLQSEDAGGEGQWYTRSSRYLRGTHLLKQEQGPPAPGRSREKLLQDLRSMEPGDSMGLPELGSNSLVAYEGDNRWRVYTDDDEYRDMYSVEEVANFVRSQGPRPSPPKPEPEPEPDPPGGVGTRDEISRVKRRIRKYKRDIAKAEAGGTMTATTQRRVDRMKMRLAEQEGVLDRLQKEGGRARPTNTPGTRTNSPKQPAPKKEPTRTITTNKSAAALLNEHFDELVATRGELSGREMTSDENTLHAKLKLALNAPSDTVKLKITNAERRAIVTESRLIEDRLKDKLQEAYRQGDPAAAAKVYLQVNKTRELLNRAERGLPLEGGGTVDPVLATGFRPEKREMFQKSFQMAMSVHSLPPGVHKIIVNRGDPRQSAFLGRYWQGSNRMELVEYTGHNTAWHEMGHWLDWMHIPPTPGLSGYQGRYASEAPKGKQPKAMTKLMAALEETQNIKKLRSQAAMSRRPPKHLSYLLQKREIFARAYAQYIGTKTQDSDAMMTVRRRASALMNADHWHEDDFQPIVPIFDELMKELGWTP